MLTQRRLEIFKAIVEEYIRTAEPVGSKTLMQKYDMPYSSATIRNDMQVLEEIGYLEKTHTSSGRVPSTEGYKFYCENLLKESALDQKMEVAIRKAFDAQAMNMDEAVKQSCAILSEMTNLTTGAIGPDASHQRLEHIKVFPLDDENAVCVFITNTGHTETKTFHFEESVPFRDLEACTEVLNSKLKHVPVDQLPMRMEELRSDLATISKRHDLLFTAFVQAFVKFASDNVYFSGKDRMLYQPEFEDIEKLKELMSMLENSEQWKNPTGASHAVATTCHGAQLSWYNDVAVVRSTFRVSDNDSGQLLVVGPSRMNYDKIVSMVEYAARLIEKMYGSGGDNQK